jgi:hypothetical protein
VVLLSFSNPSTVVYSYISVTLTWQIHGCRQITGQNSMAFLKIYVLRERRKNEPSMDDP